MSDFFKDFYNNFIDNFDSVIFIIIVPYLLVLIFGLIIYYFF